MYPSSQVTSLQDTAAASIRNLFAGLQENAANKKAPEIKKDLAKIMNCIEVGDVFGIAKADFKSMPMFGADALGFKKMPVRLNWDDDFSDISHDVQPYERWALPLRPLNDEEKNGAVVWGLQSTTATGILTMGGGGLAFDAAVEFASSLSRFSVGDVFGTIGALGLGGALTYYTIGKTFRNAKRLSASFADKTLVAVLPQALNTTEAGHMTGAGMQANLMKVQLGRTSAPMPKMA